MEKLFTLTQKEHSDLKGLNRLLSGLDLMGNKPSKISNTQEVTQLST